jgi:hypothetical protein
MIWSGTIGVPCSRIQTVVRQPLNVRKLGPGYPKQCQPAARSYNGACRISNGKSRVWAMPIAMPLTA